jgi:hypothetical protein
MEKNCYGGKRTSSLPPAPFYSCGGEEYNWFYHLHKNNTRNLPLLYYILQFNGGEACLIYFTTLTKITREDED